MAKVRNFESKSARKARRKSIVRAYLANKVADVQVSAQKRGEFYRQLRMMKMNRHRAAAAIRQLGPAVEELKAQVIQWGRRSDYADADYVDTAVRLLNKASRDATENAAEYANFAQERIYYRKDAA